MKFRMKAQRLTESSQAEPGAASSSAYEPLRSCCASRGRGCCPGYFRKHWTHTTSADGDERGRAPMRVLLHNLFAAGFGTLFMWNRRVVVGHRNGACLGTLDQAGQSCLQ